MGRIKHGEAYSRNCDGTAEYRVWTSMLSRCSDTNSPVFDRYGGRGIRVCDRWLTYVNFIHDMGRRPHGFTIDRIDNNAGYCKENCRWASRKTQQRNRSNTVEVEYKGRKMLLLELSETTGVEYLLLWDRIFKHGWSVERSVSEPIIKSVCGEMSGMSKLKSGDIQEILSLLKKGAYQKDIAKKFGVTQTTISRVKLGQTWRHIQKEAKCH